MAWIACDSDGDIYIYKEKLFRNSGLWCVNDSFHYVALNSNLKNLLWLISNFDKISWETEPIEIEIVRK